MKSVPEIKQTIALLETLTTVEEPVVREIVLEGSVLVNIAKPEKVYTFKDNAEWFFVHAVKLEVMKYERVDIVFDTSKKNSLKWATHQKRERV